MLSFQEHAGSGNPIVSTASKENHCAKLLVYPVVPQKSGTNWANYLWKTVEAHINLQMVIDEKHDTMSVVIILSFH